ncbi:MAG: hypothetical protein ACE5R4_17025 [Armatimonadota bacterium]
MRRTRVSPYALIALSVVGCAVSEHAGSEDELDNAGRERAGSRRRRSRCGAGGAG